MNKTSNRPELAALTKGILDSMRQLPDCGYKRFCTWILEQDELSDAWLYLTGIHGLIRLTDAMLLGLLDADELSRVMPFSVPMNVFQMYEVVSDNVAIGLSSRAEDDTTYEDRRALVCDYNHQTICRLTGQTNLSGFALLAPRAPAMARISTFRQSLSAHKHERLAQAFLTANPEVDPREIEYALHPQLAANIESCLSVVDALEGHESQPLVRDGLRRRYEAMTRMLNEPHMPWAARVRASVDTIMVVPTIASYGAVIAERARPLPAYRALLHDGSLEAAYDRLALLVRLLNDIGTLLLEQRKDERDELFHALESLSARERPPTFRALMLRASKLHPELLSRICKDLRFRELNLALTEIPELSSVEDGLSVFRGRLEDLSSLYRQARAGLSDELCTLRSRLGDDVLCVIVSRFFEVHRKTYSYSFTDARGEYGV